MSMYSMYEPASFYIPHCYTLHLPLLYFTSLQLEQNSIITIYAFRVYSSTGLLVRTIANIKKIIVADCRSADRNVQKYHYCWSLQMIINTIIIIPLSNTIINNIRERSVIVISKYLSWGSGNFLSGVYNRNAVLRGFETKIWRGRNRTEASYT